MRRSASRLRAASVLLALGALLGASCSPAPPPAPPPAFTQARFEVTCVAQNAPPQPLFTATVESPTSTILDALNTGAWAWAATGAASRAAAMRRGFSITTPQLQQRLSSRKREALSGTQG